MIGTVLGNRYELLEMIGEGSITEVYKAKCRMLNRIVAIKVLKQRYSNDRAFAEKYNNEAIKSARISDSRIVNILDVGSQENINYTVMEYVEGKSLKQILKERGRLNIPTAVHLIREVSKALDYAHQNDLLHLGIRPSNILISHNGDIKLSDFSIASSFFVMNVYSANYYSPEQFDEKALDVRSDIYSLGIVFYEMLTGQAPFIAESSVAIALKHINFVPIEPMMLQKDIPLGLNNLILKAMEVNKDNRYPIIKTLLLDLDLNLDSSLGVNYMSKKTYVTPNKNVERKTSSVSKLPIKKNILKKKHKDVLNNAEEATIIKPKRHKKVLNKKKFLSAMGAIIVFIGVIYAMYTFTTKYVSVKVPTIIGLSQTQAVKLVEAKKLKFVAVEKVTSSQPAGAVVKCYPAEGSSVKVNSEVRVILSTGSSSNNTQGTGSTDNSSNTNVSNNTNSSENKSSSTENKTVPSVVNKTVSTAKSKIASSGFNYGITYLSNSKVKKNTVISQSPSANSNVSASTVINLFVSRGPN